MSAYQVVLNANDPEITLQVPLQILRDLVRRSEENGTTVESEMSIRLARSLERDLAMFQEDEMLAEIAYQAVSNSNNIH